MDTTQVVERRAGRELDAEIAEKVMGWKPWRSPSVPYGDARFDCWRTGSRTNPTMRISGWSPSTDIAAAFQVVEAVQRKHPGWRFSMLGGDVRMGYVDGSPSKGVDEGSRYAFGWHAEVFGDMDPRLCTGQRHGEAYAETAPLAICLAALDAVERGHPKSAG